MMYDWPPHSFLDAKRAIDQGRLPHTGLQKDGVKVSKDIGYECITLPMTKIRDLFSKPCNLY